MNDEPYCGPFLISGVDCHGVIDPVAKTITLHDFEVGGTGWDKRKEK